MACFLCEKIKELKKHLSPLFQEKKQGKFVYLDHAATTPLHKEVLVSMKPYLSEVYGNASSLHWAGREARQAIEKARASVAKTFECSSEEIIFTSSGTESDNVAILGFARANKEKGNHIITSSIEHHAVLHCMKQLEKEGFEITYLTPDESGVLSVQQVKKALRKETILVSVMCANNEIGTIQPIAEIGNLIEKYRIKEETSTPVFHTDACQATQYLDLNTKQLHVDLMTINGGKIYGPKGVGVLYRKRGIKLQPIQFGGSQEKRLRPGTENTAAIVGMQKALEISQAQKETETTRQTTLRDYFTDRILTEIGNTVLNGDPNKRLPNNINISFLGIEGEALLLYLDNKGVAVSTGSACTSQSLEPSHVLTSMGATHEVAHSSIRFTLGTNTTKEELDYVLNVLPEIVEKLRVLSPLT